ncbi:glycosyltransferase [Bradyrhizobium prioriisuperbiae]|uniref:glycosyltransferase n=1 Tax=Bradyrhizobium prioriisuperbiae TaxID=2854389 RepID=UPI0028E927A5|nr:glycosyltransferase [Bradyrhizobium prioritasuperba]
MLLLVAVIGFAAWIYLVGFRGGFWINSRFNNLPVPAARSEWPEVVAVIPARDEASSIGNCIRSLLSQPYAGRFSIILVDDQSSDGTAELAAKAAAEIGAADRLTVISGRTPPAGWTGKLWALKQGLSRVEEREIEPTYVLLTDADIVYSGDVLPRLVTRADDGKLAMTSVMAKLRCESFAEQFLIPAFIFFFQMLYPFSWVARPDRSTAAAAGGCLLARWDALYAAGGIDAIRGALIDDCAMGGLLKSRGPVWLGFSQGVSSVRESKTFDDVGGMITRSAYAQLQYSPLNLAGTILSMAVVYLAPVIIALIGGYPADLFALGSWALMAIAFQPTLRYYRRSPLWGLILPAIAFAYLMYTINSAYQYYRGRGGMWKGRAQANLSGFR